MRRLQEQKFDAVQYKQADRPKIRQNKERGQRFVPAGPGWAHETRTNKGG